MLINLRGTNGAGKTSVVWSLMGRCPHKPIYGALGSRLPEAYVLMPELSPVYLIGPYLTPNGGCDRVMPFALIPQLIETYAQQGHVIFEGLLMSTFYGEIGRMIMETQNSVVMFLDTPLDVCIKRVKARRKMAGNFRPFNPKLLAQKHATIARLKHKFGARALSVSDRNATATIMRLLSTSTQRTPDSGGHVRRRGP
jgi:thymidylate kinase